jgi:hypothetical protein
MSWMNWLTAVDQPRGHLVHQHQLGAHGEHGKLVALA